MPNKAKEIHVMKLSQPSSSSQLLPGMRGGILAFFEVSLVWVSAVAALEGGMKALFTLGRAVRMATGMEVSWMLATTYVAVGIVCALGGLVSKG